MDVYHNVIFCHYHQLFGTLFCHYHQHLPFPLSADGNDTDGNDKLTCYNDRRSLISLAEPGHAPKTWEQLNYTVSAQKLLISTRKT